MKPRTRNILLGSIAALGVAYAALIRGNTEPSDCHFDLDLTKLRAAASSIPGERPGELRVERLTTFHMPEAVVVTGGRWGLTDMEVYAYQLVFPDRTIIVDTALNEPLAKEMMGDAYDNAAWTRLERAMLAASEIYVTHEHADHLGGLTAILSSTTAIARARLTREQLDHPDRLEPGKIPEAAKAQLKPLEYEGLRAVAPGVVLIKAPGHTPGSQLVFISLATGKEILLTGDTAWHVENIDRVAQPPRLVTYLGLKNDRGANACQLAAIRALGAADPKVGIMPGHDAPRMKELEKQGFVERGFR